MCRTDVREDVTGRRQNKKKMKRNPGNRINETKRNCLLQEGKKKKDKNIS